MLITSETYKSWGAHPEVVSDFEQTFPHGVEWPNEADKLIMCDLPLPVVVDDQVKFISAQLYERLFDLAHELDEIGCSIMLAGNGIKRFLQAGSDFKCLKPYLCTTHANLSARFPVDAKESLREALKLLESIEMEAQK